MTRLPALLLVCLLSTSLSASEPDGPALDVGQPAPEWVSTDDVGQAWKSADHVGKKIVVLYFYPGDFTGGCIQQVLAFREGLKRLEELDVELVGVSGDEVATHALFKESHGLAHTLLADPEGLLAKQLGVPVTAGVKKVRTRSLEGQPLMNEKGKSIMVERKVTLPRWTLVIGLDGKLVSKRTIVKPEKDADEVATIVAGL